MCKDFHLWNRPGWTEYLSRRRTKKKPKTNYKFCMHLTPHIKPKNNKKKNFSLSKTCYLANQKPLDIFRVPWLLKANSYFLFAV